MIAVVQFDYENCLDPSNTSQNVFQLASTDTLSRVVFSSDHESANVNLTFLHDGVGFLFAQNLGNSEFITQHGGGVGAKEEM